MQRCLDVRCNPSAACHPRQSGGDGYKHSQEPVMSITTLLIVVLIVLLLGGGFYGRGRWY